MSTVFAFKLQFLQLQNDDNDVLSVYFFKVLVDS